MSEVYEAIAQRYANLNESFRKGMLSDGEGASLVAWKYAWPLRKDVLGLAHAGATSPQEVDEANHSALFTISTYEEDRDGDIVVPRGCSLENYRQSPVVFFGHQEWKIPIGVSRRPNGTLAVGLEEKRIWARWYADMPDPDAAFIYGKVQRGILSAASIAFVPIRASRRDYEEKARTHNSPVQPPGWLFEAIDMTEWSIVGVPANAGAIRDALDSEKNFISPNLQKALVPYAAQAKGRCFSGCCPCPAPSQVEEKALDTPSRKVIEREGRDAFRKQGKDARCPYPPVSEEARAWSNGFAREAENWGGKRGQGFTSYPTGGKTLMVGKEDEEEEGTEEKGTGERDRGPSAGRYEVRTSTGSLVLSTSDRELAYKQALQMAGRTITDVVSGGVIFTSSKKSVNAKSIDYKVEQEGNKWVIVATGSGRPIEYRGQDFWRSEEEAERALAMMEDGKEEEQGVEKKATLRLRLPKDKAAEVKGYCAGVGVRFDLWKKGTTEHTIRLHGNQQALDEVIKRFVERKTMTAKKPTVKKTPAKHSCSACKSGKPCPKCKKRKSTQADSPSAGIDIPEEGREKDAQQDCVSNKIKIIAHDHPEMEQDQRVAVAYSYCSKKQVKAVGSENMGNGVKAVLLKEVTDPKVGDKVTSERGVVYQLTRFTGSNWVGKVIRLLPGSPAAKENWPEIGNFLNVDIATATRTKGSQGLFARVVTDKKGSVMGLSTSKCKTLTQAKTSLGFSAKMKDLAEGSGSTGGYTVPEEDKSESGYGWKECPKCGGDGACPQCDGKGKAGGRGETCDYCEGSGVCPECDGEKKVRKNKSTKAKALTECPGCGAQVTPTDGECPKCGLVLVDENKCTTGKGKSMKSKKSRTKAEAYAGDETPEEESQEEGGKEKPEPLPSAQMLANLYAHYKSAVDYIDNENPRHEHAEIKDFLDGHKEDLTGHMDKLKDLLEEHHPDQNMDDMVKGIEGNPSEADDENLEGESGEVAMGDVPETEVGEDAPEEKPEEEDEEDEDSDVDDQAEEEEPEEKDEDEAEPNTQEILDRYRQTPKDKKTIKGNIRPGDRVQVTNTSGGSQYQGKMGTVLDVHPDPQFGDSCVVNLDGMKPGEGILTKDRNLTKKSIKGIVRKGAMCHKGHYDTVKDAAQHMEDLSTAPDLPRHHVAGLSFHSDKLKGVVKDLEDMGTHDEVKDLTDEDNPEEQKDLTSETPTDDLETQKAVEDEEEEKPKEDEKQVSSKVASRFSSLEKTLYQLAGKTYNGNS